MRKKTSRHQATLRARSLDGDCMALAANCSWAKIRRDAGKGGRVEESEVKVKVEKYDSLLAVINMCVSR